MSVLKAIIVEDESIARNVLNNYLIKYCPAVKVVGEAEDARQAISLIHSLQPNLVFLDIEMPFGNGFDVLESCRDVGFETIFLTAFSDYAIKAINRSAAYYLLKPINIDSLVEAVDKVCQKVAHNILFDKNQIIIDNLIEKSDDRKQIVVPKIEGYDVIKIDQILRLQGNGNFTDIILKDKSKMMACRFLKHFESLLPRSFMRVHKSHIINLHAVKSYHKALGGYVIMEDNSEVEISPLYKEQFLLSLEA